MSSGKSNKQNFSRKRKKKPPVNKYSRINLSNISPENVTSSISKKRLIIDQTNLNTKSEVIRQEDDYFLFVNFSILKGLFQPLLVCPECGHKKRRGRDLPIIWNFYVSHANGINLFIHQKNVLNKTMVKVLKSTKQMQEQ